MPGTLVQSKTGQTAGAAASLSVVFDNAPTVGNLLVARAATNTSLAMTSTGWSLAQSAIGLTALYQWFKIAGASESATVTVSITASDQAEMHIVEYAGMAPSSPLDRTISSLPGTSVAAVSTGTTAATQQSDELALAAWSRQGAAAVNSISNAFAQQANISGAGGTQTTMTTAVRALALMTIVESTATFAAASSSPSGLVCTYKAAPAEILSMRNVKIRRRK